MGLWRGGPRGQTPSDTIVNRTVPPTIFQRKNEAARRSCLPCNVGTNLLEAHRRVATLSLTAGVECGERKRVASSCTYHMINMTPSSAERNVRQGRRTTGLSHIHRETLVNLALLEWSMTASLPKAPMSVSSAMLPGITAGERCRSKTLFGCETRVSSWSVNLASGFWEVCHAPCAPRQGDTLNHSAVLREKQALAHVAFISCLLWYTAGELDSGRHESGVSYEAHRPRKSAGAPIMTGWSSGLHSLSPVVRAAAIIVHYHGGISGAGS